jgi:hypothetical protein
MTRTGDPLAGLRGYHLPEPVGWWPPAPGWWALLAIALALLLLVLVLRRRARRRRMPASLAVNELDLLRAGYRRDGDACAYVRGLSELLRRFALARFPGESPAGLAGEDWLRFLAAKDGGDSFSAGIGRRLLDAPYRPQPALDPDLLAAAAERWIRRNRGARS